MANITVNVGDLYDRRAKMQKIGEELISCMDQVVNTANGVKSGWTGFNSDQYVNSFYEFKPSILKKCWAILETANGLETTAQILSELQEKTHKKIQNIGYIVHDVYIDNVKNFNIIDYKEGETFKAKRYGENYTDEELLQLTAIIAGEDSGSYEGALAVASTLCNRADLGNFRGGTDPLNLAKAPMQYVAYNGPLYNQYMADPSSIPDYVVQATKDALGGTRNTTADSFRAGQGTKGDRIQIGVDGNFYFKA